mgnify:CR=1 FL=1
MIHVSIIEDDDDIRDSLSIIINGAPDYCCSGSYEDAESAISEIATQQPDVVLMDIELPGMSGIECVKVLRESLPDADILMLTVHEDDDIVFESLCAGACGYLTKNTPPVKLLEAIREVHEGGAPMSTNIARMVISSFKKESRHGLSDREREVLALLCKGKSYKMIADDLCISSNTVRSHIKSIYRKLEVTSSSQAVARAIRDNLIRP